MKQILIVLAFITFLGCKETAKETPKVEVAEVEKEMIKEEVKSNYPEDVVKIFDAHGGLKNWRAKKTLKYTMPKPKGAETQTVDLYSRMEKIETPEVTLGYDGEAVWILDEKESYKGDANFYKNLMFYFYAMPFVLADNGINYEKVDALQYDGKSYPGFRISYDDGIGASSKDEYYLHYDSETYQMAWLGYTVTYRSGEKSDKVSWIRYNDWMSVDDVVLPKSLTWHIVKEGEIKEERNTLPFENVSITADAKEGSFYAMPENAKVAVKK